MLGEDQLITLRTPGIVDWECIHFIGCMEGTSCLQGITVFRAARAADTMTVRRREHSSAKGPGGAEGPPGVGSSRERRESCPKATNGRPNIINGRPKTTRELPLKRLIGVPKTIHELLKDNEWAPQKQSVSSLKMASLKMAEYKKNRIGALPGYILSWGTRWENPTSSLEFPGFLQNRLPESQKNTLPFF